MCETFVTSVAQRSRGDDDAPQLRAQFIVELLRT